MNAKQPVTFDAEGSIDSGVMFTYKKLRHCVAVGVMKDGFFEEIAIVVTMPGCFRADAPTYWDNMFNRAVWEEVICETSARAFRDALLQYAERAGHI